MTFRKTFNGGDDTVSELAIEFWRLKAECVERRIGAPAFPGLGLRHQEQLPTSSLPTLLRADPKKADLHPSCPSPAVQAGHDPVGLVAQENREPLPVVPTCLFHVVVVQTVEKKLDIRMRGLRLKLQSIPWHAYLPAALERPIRRDCDQTTRSTLIVLRGPQFALPTKVVQ